MSEELQHRSVSVVVLGTFAPALFHPSWFERHDLLGQHESEVASGAQSLVVSGDVTFFSVAGFDLNVQANRFQVATAQENLFGPARDLAMGSMQLLDSTPAQALGLNWVAHFALASTDEWHAAGHKIIPIEFWKRLWGKHIGMKNVTVQLAREDDLKGHVQVALQPSNVLKNGVFVSINDHYSFADDMTAPGVADLIARQWRVSEQLAFRIFSGVIRECRNA
jgi:hypothetical protein